MGEMTGRVLRIEKTSIHDGAGLRTVVFLQGCPLRCKWCSTPESQCMQFEPGYGQEMTARQVAKEVYKDEIFFFHSGGGVTLSGGEVLLQSDFAAEVLRICKENGIHTAIETSLCASYENIQKLLPHLDAIYADFKMCDDDRHRFYTGVSNRQIKENLLRLEQEFVGDLHIRIPGIPTVNLTRENMLQSGKFLRSLSKVKNIELLLYHRLGLETYYRLGRVYELKDVEVPKQEEMEAMARVLAQETGGIPVKIKGYV